MCNFSILLHCLLKLFSGKETKNINSSSDWNKFSLLFHCILDKVQVFPARLDDPEVTLSNSQTPGSDCIRFSASIYWFSVQHHLGSLRTTRVNYEINLAVSGSVSQHWKYSGPCSTGDWPWAHAGKDGNTVPCATSWAFDFFNFPLHRISTSQYEVWRKSCEGQADSCSHICLLFAYYYIILSGKAWFPHPPMFITIALSYICTLLP